MALLLKVFAGFVTRTALKHHTVCTAEPWEEVWLLTVPVGFVGIQMLLFTILLCLLIYNIKNGRMDRRALIDVTLTNCIFFFDHFIIIIFAFASLHYYSSQLITPPTFTFVPITSMLVPLTLLIAIHLPFSSIIARICLKRS